MARSTVVTRTKFMMELLGEKNSQLVGVVFFVKKLLLHAPTQSGSKNKIWRNKCANTVGK